MVDTEERTTRSRPPGSSWYLGALGVALVALGWGAVLKKSEATATALVSLGGAALIVAPFLSRIEGSLKMGPLEMTLRAQVVRVVQQAPDVSLAGVLPLLQGEDVRVARVEVPRSFAGLRLTDPKLAFVRQRLKLTVVALQLAGGERWRAGGKISEVPLQEGASLLVVGPPETLEWFRALVAADDEALWKRATS